MKVSGGFWEIGKTVGRAVRTVGPGMGRMGSAMSGHSAHTPQAQGEATWHNGKAMCLRVQWSHAELVLSAGHLTPLSLSFLLRKMGIIVPAPQSLHGV